MTPPEKSVRLRITGEVQGVGYRIWATRTAAGLQLRGWVRNRRDGSVEMLATGVLDSIEVMVEACRRGPPAARVTVVTVSDAEDDGSVGFGARSTD
jgi:acylphosphatase